MYFAVQLCYVVLLSVKFLASWFRHFCAKAALRAAVQCFQFNHPPLFCAHLSLRDLKFDNTNGLSANTVC